MLILSLIGSRSTYGYDIMVSLSKTGMNDFSFKQGTLYPLLYRLEREGLIQAKWETAESGKKRKIYSLTKQGLKIQHEHLDEWKRFKSSVDKILKDIESLKS